MHYFICKVFNSPILTGWIFNGTKLLQTVIILPFILTQFTPEEINVWFLFFTIISISEIIVFGLNTTFVRFIAYTVSGIHFSSFDKIKDKVKCTVEFNRNHQLDEILKILFIFFTAIALFYGSVLYIGGHYVLEKPISFISSPSVVWDAWFILLLANPIRICLYPFSILLQGFNKMHLCYIISTFSSMIRIIAGVILMTLQPNLLYLVILFSCVMIFNELGFIIAVLRIKSNIYRIFDVQINYEIIRHIWKKAWRSGLTKIFAPIVVHASGLIFAQISTPHMSSSYLLTQRLFNVVDSFASTSVNAKLPLIAKYRGLAKLEEVKRVIKQTTLISYASIVLGSSIIFLFGEQLLLYIKSNTTMPSISVLVLFAFAILITRNGGIQNALTNQANEVYEHKALMFFLPIYFGILLIFYNELDMWVFPFALLFAGLITNIFYIYPRSYPLYNTSFWITERYVFLPMLLLMAIISALIMI